MTRQMRSRRPHCDPLPRRRKQIGRPGPPSELRTPVRSRGEDRRRRSVVAASQEFVFDPCVTSASVGIEFGPEPLRPRWRRLLFWALLLSPGPILLVVSYVPYQDYLGHIGVNAVLAHARTGPIEPYSLRSWWGPNRLFYALSWPFLPLGPRLASQLVLALAAAGLAPAAWLLMRQAGSSGWAALWVPPFALGRIMACGFAPNALALPFMLLALAAAVATVRAPSPARTTGVLSMAVLSTAAHLFVGLATAGLLFGGGVLLGLSAGVQALRRRPGPGLIPSLVLLAGAGVGGGAALLSGSGNGASPFAALDLLALQPVSALAERLWTWSFAFTRTDPVDDAALGMTGAAMLAAGVFGWRTGRSWARALLAFFVLGLAGAFSVIPMSLGAPIHWWGAGVRLVIPLFVVLIALVDPSDVARLRAPRWAAIIVGLGTAASVLQLASHARQILHFDQVTMAGFDQVLDLVEARTAICSLHASDANVPEFPGDALWYASNLVLAEKLVPTEANLFGNPGVMVARKSEPPHAPYGRLRLFPWQQARSHCPQLLIAGTIDPVTESRLRAFGYGSVSFGNWTLATR